MASNQSAHPDSPQAHISVTIQSHSDRGDYTFSVPVSMAVGAFLKLVLDKLVESGHGERINSMLECYEPVLEHCREAGPVPLLNSMTLVQAGLADRSVCRLSGRPRKEELMFCRYS